MITTKFAPKDHIPEFISELGQRLYNAMMTAQISEEKGNVRIDNVRLMASKPHTSPYDERYNRNWHIETRNEAKHGLVGVNNNYPNMVVPIKMSSALNYDDWAVFNTIFNETADDWGVSVNLKSSWGVIRKGTQRGNW